MAGMELPSLRSAMFATGLVSAWSASAQDTSANTASKISNFYVNGGAGVAIMRNVLTHGGDPFDVGPKVVLSAGYDVSRNIAVELQSGFAHNSWPTVFTAHSPLPPSIQPPVDIWTVPVMVNGVYQHVLYDHWRLYGGAGAGIVISTLRIEQKFFPGANVASTDCEFGYHAMVGIKYHFNDHWETGLGYDFLGSLDHHWSGNGFGIVTGPTYMHSVLLSLTCKF